MLSDKLRDFVCDNGAEIRLATYARAYSGAWFQGIGGRGDDPAVADRLTTDDIVAVSTLSVNVPGWAAIELLHDRASTIARMLSHVPADVDLHEASDQHLEALFALQDTVQQPDGIGPVTRSKLLARKRPCLVPIRDAHVLRTLVGSEGGDYTRPLRDALAADEAVQKRLHQLSNVVPMPGLSMIRVLDIVVWMSARRDSKRR